MKLCKKTSKKPSLDDDPRYEYTDPRPKIYHPFTLPPMTYMGTLAHEALCELRTTRAVTDPVYARAVVYAYIQIKTKKADKLGLGRDYVNAKLTMLERQAGEHWEPTFHHIRGVLSFPEPALIPRPQLSAWARWNQPLIQPPRPQPPSYAACMASEGGARVASGASDGMWSTFMGGTRPVDGGKPLPPLPPLTEKH